MIRSAIYSPLRFLSTPSGWRATADIIMDEMQNATISIHALRVEGDWRYLYKKIRERISIHALRVEGDSKCTKSKTP
mgnify:CR=1 FL=1